MKALLLAAVAALTLSACGNQIKDFVDVGGRAPATPPAAGNAGQKVLKLSPGHVEASGTAVSARMTLTPRERKLTGSGTDATLSLQQTRIQ